jgi:hypothetical protein
MAPGMTIAGGITVGLVAFVAFAMALSHGMFASKQRQEAAETALVEDHEETARINHEIGRQAEAQDSEDAAAKAAAYEQIPEIQVLRALEAEDRSELAKRPPSFSLGSTRRHSTLYERLRSSPRREVMDNPISRTRSTEPHRQFQVDTPRSTLPLNRRAASSFASAQSSFDLAGRQYRPNMLDLRDLCEIWADQGTPLDESG